MSIAENDEQRGKRVRFARLLLIIGLGVVFFQLLPALPHEQRVVFRFDPTTSVRVRRLDVSWSIENEHDALGGFVSEFPEGAPPIVERTMNLPNGRYEFSINAIVATADSERTITVTRTRRASLDGGETTLLLKDLVP